MKPKREFDVIILGGGIAGMTAAIYTARANLFTVIIDTMICGGLVNSTHLIENFPSYISIHGMELMEKVQEQVLRLGVETDQMAEITSLDITTDVKKVETEEYIYTGKAIILATGREPVKLDVETDCEEIHYCAVCDGSDYKGKRVLVVGGGNSGFDEALYLLSLGVQHLMLIEVADRFFASQTAQDKLTQFGHVVVKTSTRIKEIVSGDKLQSVILENVHTGEADIAQVTFDQAVHLEEKGVQRCHRFGSFPDYDTAFWPMVPVPFWLDPNLPWLDKRVREAMNLAINREEIAQFLFHGYAKPTFGIIPYEPSWVTGLEPYPYDPDRAKQLLANAGYPNGFKLKLWDVTIANRVPEMSEVLLAVASNWGKVGLEVEIATVNIMAIYGDIVTRSTTGNSMGMTFADYGIYSGAYTVVMHSQEGTFPMYESEQTDEWINDWLAATTPEEKNTLAEQITRYIHEEFVSVPVVKADAVWSTGEEIVEWKPFNIVNLKLEYAAHS